MTGTKRILVLNAGSSSLKCVVYEAAGPSSALSIRPPAPLWEAQADWSALPGPIEFHAVAHGADAAPHPSDVPREKAQASSLDGVTEHLLHTMVSGPARIVDSLSAIDLIGHRVVHGGARFHESVRVDEEVLAAIDELSELAPLHNPLALAGIRATTRLMPGVPQYAVFDTAFHFTMPVAARTYPLPYEWVERGIRKYGFHGLSHRYVARRAADLLGRSESGLRVITCHLGNGCSLAAVKDGRSVDTTMGFTPLDGLMMGSRSGAINPGILLHLLQRENKTPADLDRMLSRESGLLGLSGVSSDMRDVLAASKDGNERARLAVEVFVYRLTAFIASLLPALGGLDALVFTGGIGENAAAIRAAACDRLAFPGLGLRLDEERNGDIQGTKEDRLISASSSMVAVLVIRTEESWEIVRECLRLA